MKIHTIVSVSALGAWRIRRGSGPAGCPALPLLVVQLASPSRLSLSPATQGTRTPIRRHHTQPPAALLPPPFIYTSSPLPPGKRSSGQATLQHTHKHTDTHVEPTPLVRPSALGLATLTSQKHPSVQVPDPVLTAPVHCTHSTDCCAPPQGHGKHVANVSRCPILHPRPQPYQPSAIHNTTSTPIRCKPPTVNAPHASNHGTPKPAHHSPPRRNPSAHSLIASGRARAERQGTA
jgi:hypothetical protein